MFRGGVKMSPIAAAVANLRQIHLGKPILSLMFRSKMQICEYVSSGEVTRSSGDLRMRRQFRGFQAVEMD
jgi:hypothetical protein